MLHADTHRRALAYSLVVPSLFVLGLVAAPTPASAQTEIADFYKGKTIKVIIRSSPGGSYDLYSRMVARHIGRFIPGNPQAIPINMPGGGGLTSVNHVANQEPRDGTVLTMPAVGITMYQALGFFGDTLKADIGQFHWVGNLSSSNPVLATYKDSKVKTLDDAKKMVAHLGTSGAGSISAQLPAVYNNLLGTKFKVLYGFDGDDAIAMERGEIDGRASNTYASYAATQRDWVDNKKLNWILQVGLKKEKELPNVPLLRELATNDEQQQIFDFLSKVVVNSRAIMTTPGTPPARVAALRKAFVDMVNDKTFIDEAVKQNAEIGFMEGSEVQALNHDILTTPKPLLDKLKVYMQHKTGDEIKYEVKK
jgi:tripartite-type tricarboxylate transporter receptor subunit TctC